MPPPLSPRSGGGAVDDIPVDPALDDADNPAMRALIRYGVGLMVLWVSILLVGLRPASAQRDGMAAEWRALATTALGEDTLVVRASWLSHEPVSGQSTYVGYRIEDLHGSVWASDTIPDVRSLEGGWCDALTCRVSPWKAGLVFTMTATCWPCYPSVCDRNQFVYLRARHVTARSEWVDIQWDPARGDTAFEWRQSDCMEYAVPLVARIPNATSRFEWQYPPSTASRTLRVPGGQAECAHDWEVRPPKWIAVFSAPDDPVPDSVLVGPEDDVEVRSAFILVSSTESGVFTEISRVEIVIAGRHWFADSGVLTNLGYWEP
jgi:hypothetical protein